jgi:hypothetical protein
MQDPKIAALMGQNPQAQAIQAAAYAHVNEDIAFQYRKQFEEQLGVQLPDTEDKAAPEVDNGVAKLIAMAAAKLSAKNASEAQQQKAQEASQDPLVQIQQQELEIKKQDAQTKAQKAQADIQNDQAKIEIDKMRIESTERIALITLEAKDSTAHKGLDIKHALEGHKLNMQHEHHGNQMDANLQQQNATTDFQQQQLQQQLQQQSEVGKDAPNAGASNESDRG